MSAAASNIFRSIGSSITSSGRAKLVPRSSELPLFSADWSDYKRAFINCFTLSLVGLYFYPAILIWVILMTHQFKTQHRYDVLFTLTLGLGAFGVTHPHSLPGGMLTWAFVAAFICFVIYRKVNPLIKKLTIAIVIYFAAIVAIALTSDETLPIQARIFRKYFLILYTFVPLAIFADKSFDYKEFFRVLTVYCMILCWFYVIDGFILQGWFLIPNSWRGGIVTTFSNIEIHPFTTFLPRKWPSGLFFLTLMIYPVIYLYRLPRKYYILVLASFAVTKTISFILSLVVTFLIFKFRGMKLLLYVGLTAVGISLLYTVDVATGSNLRIASTIEQFTSLDNAVDDEDLAEFGSGRMAQILPKWELMTSLNRQWLGLGFLHPDLTTNPKYIIVNEYYSDLANSEEVAGLVEETHVETILFMGFLGFIIQCAFFIYIYILIKDLPHSKCYLTCLIAVNIAGIGGFEGMTSLHGLLILSLSLAPALLSQEARAYGLRGSNLPENKRGINLN